MKKIFRQGPILLLLLLCALFLGWYGRTQMRPATAEAPIKTAETEAAQTPQTPETAPSFESESEEESRLSASLRISEAMPSNKACLFDEDGESSDWVELINIGEDAVSLENCWLSDQEKNVRKWQIPAIRMDGGERVVLFCSGKDRTEGEYHTNFSLSKAGGQIFLCSPSGLLIDAVTYGETGKDRAVVFRPDEGEADGEPAVTWMATPGFPNSREGYEAWLEKSDEHGPLVIEEAVCYNGSYQKQNGECYDWLELKNTSDEPLNLGQYRLSDDEDHLQKTRLPERQLQPGERFVVFCSGDSSMSGKEFFHADFRIGTDERLYVSDGEGRISDRLWVHDMPLNGSIGRMDGRAGAFYFAQPTPGEENGEGFRLISEKPKASAEQGVYPDQEELTVALSGKGKIYYTLDGSVPDGTDSLYEEPIRVTDTTVLRAVSIEEGKLTSSPATFSYILHGNDSLPVTSLVCDPKEMFGAGGVYTAGRGAEARSDASVSFFAPEGEGFSADCSVELHGAKSRESFRKKSFELKFASRYGGSISCDLFGDGKVTEFSSLLLRGGTCVNLDTVRDCFASMLTGEVCPSLYPQNVRYTAVYINGEYYGVYAWREAYSEEYFEAHTGSPAEGVRMARVTAPPEDLLELFRYITTHNMADSECYNYVDERLDLDSLACWMGMEAWFDNQDINGNIRYVKLSENAKWQMVLYDLDFSLLNTEARWNNAKAATQLGPVNSALLKNPEYRERFLRNCAGLTERGLTAENAAAVLDRLLLPLDEETVKKDCERWNDPFLKWKRNIIELRSHLTEERMVSWVKGLQKLTLVSREEMHKYFPEYY